MTGKDDVRTEAEYRGQKYFIINRDYWHLTHDGGMLSHNVFLSKGFSFSTSAVNLIDNLQNAVTFYGLNARFSDKEKVWEEIRKKEFPELPTRINALFLFDSKELAQQMAVRWFENDNRILVRAHLVDGSLTYNADAKWLDGATTDNAERQARSYWSGEMTSNPVPETIACGLVHFPDWKQWAKFMKP